MPLHDTSYQHWDGVPLGIWRRRWAITHNGLSTCFQNKWLRYLMTLCWSAALAMTAILFLVGQLLVADSVVAQWVPQFNPVLQAFARMLTTWLEQHPNLSVHTTQNLLFVYFGNGLLRMSIFALGLALPVLITRDLASNAIIIYSSKAINRGDYLLGKFATAAGLVGITWLGPMVAAWFLGNLLAPDWRFFWYSRAVLGHVLAFGLVSTAILSLLALGVSAISAKERSTTTAWYLWWILGGVVAPIALHTQPWLQHLSFNYNLEQIGLAIFRPGNDLTTAQENLPILGEMLRNIPPPIMEALNDPTAWGAAFASLVMLCLAVLVIRRQVKPE